MVQALLEDVELFLYESEMLREAEEKAGIFKRIWSAIKGFNLNVPKEFVVKYFNRLYKLQPMQLREEVSKLRTKISEIKKKDPNNPKIKKLEQKVDELNKKWANFDKLKASQKVNWKNVIITTIVVAVVVGAIYYVYKRKKSAKVESVVIANRPILEQVLLEADEKQSAFSKAWNTLKNKGIKVPKDWVLKQLNRLFKLTPMGLTKEMEKVKKTLHMYGGDPKVEKEMEAKLKELKKKRIVSAVVISAIIITIVALAIIYYRKKQKSTGK